MFLRFSSAVATIAALALATNVTAEGSFEECVLVPSIPEDRRTDPDQLRVATFNAEFLFTKGLGQLKCPGKDCEWKTQEAAMDHIEGIAKVVYDMDADIIQLNEVEDCTALKLLVKEVAKLGDDTYVPYIIRGDDRFTAQNAAIITRVDPIDTISRVTERVEYPVPKSSCGKFPSQERKSKGVSKNILARFDVAGFSSPITMIGVHFLARPQDTKRCFEREAQASVIAKQVEVARKAGDHVIVLGDYNDFSNEVLDIQSSLPISNVMGILADAGMENIGNRVPQEERYSNWWDRNSDCVYRVPEEVSALDHIMMTKCLADQISTVSYGTELFKMACGSPYSDHFPVIATLKSNGGSCSENQKTGILVGGIK